MSESVRDTIKGAVAELAGDVPEAALPIETPAIEPNETITAEAETAPARDRDETGRFKAKEPTAEAGAETATAEPTKEPETAEPAEQEPQTEAIRVPPSLPAAVKAQWSELKPEVQQAFHKLEDSVQTAKAEWGKKGERLNRYDEIIAPRLEKLQLQGIDEFTYIKTLAAAQDYLERDPVGGLQYLARSYGVDLRQLAGQALQMTGAEGQQAPTLPPELQRILQPLQQQVQTLQQELAQTRQLSEAEKFAQARSEVDTFASDPANMYFENVRPVVAKLIETGQAATLKDAYDMAIWASPEIRPLLLNAQAQQAQATTQEAQARKTAEETQRRKAQQAAHAGGSVTGAPTLGATPPGPGSTGNLRQDLEAARQALAARA